MVMMCIWSQKTYRFARVAQLVEHNLAKVGVASSNLVSRSKSGVAQWLEQWYVVFFGDARNGQDEIPVTR